MAGKSKKVKVVSLVAKDDKGKITFTYHVRKNTRLEGKLRRRKYNPVTKSHQEFVESSK